MPYIRTISPSEADGELARLFRRAGNPDGTVDDVMLVHSLSPESLRAHFELYVVAMHKPSPLSRIEREMVGAFVSRLNGCDYCVAHHRAGLARLLRGNRPDLPDALAQADGPDPGVIKANLSGRERAMLAYAGKLTRAPDAMTQADADALRAAGLDDRAILDLAQVVSYFCYANRMVLGLGAKIESFTLGQHPAPVADADASA